MFDTLEILSRQGPYIVVFERGALRRLNATPPEKAQFIIDANVARIYREDLSGILSSSRALVIEAMEPNKNLDKFSGYIASMMENSVRRDHVLVAIGGGIIQDIVCFLAATLFRGLAWQFFPTTLLAQADSCIGSKSSINVGPFKNILGTFNPPQRIFIDVGVLSTLAPKELRSGVGEMLKVHAIEGPSSFDAIARDYQGLFEDPVLMQQYIFQSLTIKKKLIEEDELDQGPRNILNYGHSFGHAIESATEFAVPHGIAVSIGGDMANWVAYRLGLASAETFHRMHPVLSANYTGFENQDISASNFLAALRKDKKNVGDRLKLVLPGRDGRLGVGLYDNDQRFRQACEEFFATIMPGRLPGV